MSIYELAETILGALRGHPFLGCDCCAQSTTSHLWDWVTDSDDWEFYTFANDYLGDREWLLALDLAAAVLGIQRGAPS